VHMDAVRFHRAMFYFAHCTSSMVHRTTSFDNSAEVSKTHFL
jgi:hypothetical protein